MLPLYARMIALKAGGVLTPAIMTERRALCRAGVPSINPKDRCVQLIGFRQSGTAWHCRR